jgi:hypothetical protein
MLRAKERQARVQLKYREFFYLPEFQKFSDKDGKMLADAINGSEGWRSSSEVSAGNNQEYSFNRRAVLKQSEIKNLAKDI